MRIEAKKQDEVVSAGSDLIAVKSVMDITATEFFRPGGSDSILEQLKTEVRKRASALDISTETNRKALASLAYQVAKSKTFLDKQRKSLVEDEKKRLKAIDQEGSRIWDELEALQEEVRKPLTDWENAEKDRIAKHESAIHIIESEGQSANEILPIITIESKIALVNQIYGRDWQEFSQRAEAQKILALSKLEQALHRAQDAENQRKELERLRAEAAERARIEREESIAREAREKAQREAQAREEAIKRAAEEERLRVENERYLAEARARQAEAERIAAEERAARELAAAEERRIAEEKAAEQKAKEAAEKAERDKQKAIEEERRKVAEEKSKETEEAEARARNRANQTRVNREILSALTNTGASEDLAKAIIAAIVKGDMPHLYIRY